MTLALRLQLLFVAAAFGLPQPAARTIAAGQQPMAIAINESTHKAYIANHGSSSVTVIDGRTGTVVATIRTGSSPV